MSVILPSLCLANRLLQLADFGLATVLSLPTYKVVEPVGTPGYSAPELLRVLPYDGQVDVFSLGVVSFVLLSGECSGLNPLLSVNFGSWGAHFMSALMLQKERRIYAFLVPTRPQPCTPSERH